MLEIENLTKHFGAVTAVAGLSLSVGQGEVLGFFRGESVQDAYAQAAQVISFNGGTL